MGKISDNIFFGVWLLGHFRCRALAITVALPLSLSLSFCFSLDLFRSPKQIESGLYGFVQSSELFKRNEEMSKTKTKIKGHRKQEEKTNIIHSMELYNS